MKVSEIRPYAKKIDLVVRAISKNGEREVSSRLDSSTHKVTEALVGDESGTVLLTLWDDAIAKVEEGKTYKLTNAYASFFKNSLRINLGRFGTAEENAESVENVNSENNLSEKEFSGNRA